MNISIHIEQLVLDGIPVTPDGRPLLQAAAEAELSRLLAGQGLASHLEAGGALRGVRGGTIDLAERASPTDLGQQIARAVYQGIGR
jgi:hypothetical protein